MTGRAEYKASLRELQIELVKVQGTSSSMAIWFWSSSRVAMPEEKTERSNPGSRVLR